MTSSGAKLGARDPLGGLSKHLKGNRATCNSSKLIYYSKNTRKTSLKMVKTHITKNTPSIFLVPGCFQKKKKNIKKQATLM